MHITYALYDDMTALDFIGPYEVFGCVPGMEISFAAAEAGTITTDSGLVMGTPIAFRDIDSTDILLVPGGGKTHHLVGDTEIVRFISRIHPTTTWTTSVCTGSLLLASAGVLEGLTATTHWSAMGLLEKLGAIPVKARSVRHEGIMTAAGVSAGIDMALTLVAELFGEEVAKAAQLGLEYDPQPPFDSGSPDKASKETTDLVLEMLKVHD